MAHQGESNSDAVALARGTATPDAAPAAPSPTISRQPRGGPLPLSFGQERLWFLEERRAGGSAYNIPLVLEMRGALDAAALEAAYQALVKRHESLRTRFDTVNGAAMQVIEPSAALRLGLIDLSHLPEGARNAAARRLSREEASRPFDLRAAPLLRITLLKLAAREHILLTTMHHIISDGWSAAVLIRELCALYAGLVENRPVPLRALDAQYADYAVWQRAWLQGDVRRDHVDYWKKSLAGAPAALSLPTDRPRAPAPSFDAASVPFELDAVTTRALRAVAHRQQATLFMALLAGLQIILSRWSGQENVVVGTAVAGRTQRATRNLIGFFINMLPLRTDLSGDPTFRELLDRVKRVAFGAYEHQDLPFKVLVDEVRPPREAGRQPLFQVLLIFHNTPPILLDIPGLQLRAIDAEATASPLEICLSVREEANGLHGYFEYATDLFDAATIGELGRDLQVLLEGIASDAERRLSQLPPRGDRARRDRTAHLTQPKRWHDPTIASDCRADSVDLLGAAR
jgi:hypothetical protein